MHVARSIVPVARQSVGRSFYRNFQFSSTNCDAAQFKEATQPQVKEEKFDFEDLKVIDRTERRKPKIEPFMKNVFISSFNRDLLAFPEILNKEETEELDQRVEKLEKVFGDTETTEKDRLNALQHHRMFAAPVNITNGGLAMNVTERIRYIETISTDLKLAKRLSEHWVCLEALKLGLIAEDFERLLPKLTTGESTIAMCTKETVSTRIAQADFRTKAELDTHGVWRISGEKECYSEYGYYLVLCSLEAGRLQAFLVEAGAEGVGYQAPQVTFRGSPGTPLSHVSEACLSRVLGMSRLDVCVTSLAALRRAVRATAHYVRGKFVAGKPLAEVSTIRARIGEALLTAYAAESAAYFTAGLLDGYESPDADMEMALCRNFTSQHAARSLLALQGIPGLQQDEEFHRRLDEVRRLTWDETDDNVNMYIALNGIHHAGKALSQEIKKIRNPLLHPNFIFKKIFADRFQENDKPKLTLYLAEHLHPSLKPPSELLEYCVLRMRYACESVMARHGNEVFRAHTELERLSLAATEILAMTAVLARASRSYCIGLRNAEIEMRLAACFVEQSRPRVRQLILDLENGEYLNLDHYKIDFGKKVLDSKDLLVEKATERVFW